MSIHLQLREKRALATQLERNADAAEIQAQFGLPNDLRTHEARNTAGLIRQHLLPGLYLEINTLTEAIEQRQADAAAAAPITLSTEARAAIADLQSTMRGSLSDLIDRANRNASSNNDRRRATYKSKRRTERKQRARAHAA